VRLGDTPILVDADAGVWTSNAVGIRFAGAGKQQMAWVWASAVLKTEALLFPD